MTKKLVKRSRATKKKRTVSLPRSVKNLFPQVEYATDATKPVYVSVNKKDCDDAQALNPMDCALARATKREKNADGVIIGMSSSYIIRGKEAVRYATPESVRREIVSFDRHHDFATGDYHLRPKSLTAKFGTEKNKNPNKRNKGYDHDAQHRRVHQSVRVRALAKGYAPQEDL